MTDTEPAHAAGSGLDDTGGGLRPAFAFALVAILGCGLAYPLAITFVAGLAWPDQARGSVVTHEGRPVGSRLVAQRFDGDAWFHPRPSACDYSVVAAAGSNLAPSNPALAARLGAEALAVAAREAIPAADVPVDLVTASGSGVDPHVSPEGALVQAPRVARARGWREDELQRLVLGHVEARDLWLLGRPRVNVLLLNLALHQRSSGPAEPAR